MPSSHVKTGMNLLCFLPSTLMNAFDASLWMHLGQDLSIEGLRTYHSTCDLLTAHSYPRGLKSIFMDLTKLNASRITSWIVSENHRQRPWS
jgi:hypothetical protein